MYTDIIRVFDNTLSKEFCEELIETYENHPGKDLGLTGGGYKPTVKNCVDLYISNQEDLRDLDNRLHETLSPYVQQYVRELEEQASAKFEDMHPFPTDVVRDSGYNMKKYEPNEGKFNWHSDNLTTIAGNVRLIGIIWYLNDVQEGGYTEFFDGTKIQPATGRLLLFPATWTYPHRGVVAPTKKYIITSFLSYKAFVEDREFLEPPLGLQDPGGNFH